MSLPPNSSFVDENHFEREVRRLAKVIWPEANVQRAPMIDNHERDALVETKDFIYVIEATTSRNKAKADTDGKKTHELVTKIRKQGFMCRGILVTLCEPTSDQEAIVKKWANSLTIESYDEFLSRLFDVPEYLEARVKKPFGSILNPADRGFELGREFYIPLPIVDDGSTSKFSAEDLADAIATDSRRFVLLSDFGSGKSMAAREIFYHLRAAYLAKKHCRFPVYINLRDHHGAKYPDEVLERHARDIGLANYDTLVKAWRAGFADLILDGFDELASGGWTANKFKLRNLRQLALEAVRRLIAESPQKSGIVLIGRQHYFDSVREMRSALSISENYTVLRIPTLSEEDARKIVVKYGGNSAPHWIPGRALLLSYLAAKKVLGNHEDLFPATTSRGQGWDSLLRMICQREAAQHPALDGDAILTFLERLATRARTTPDGLGSFSEDDLARIFQETCGFAPDDAARLLISRLPAIGQLSADTGLRRFVDQDVADAARSGDVLRFIESPYDTRLMNDFSEAETALGSSGVDRLSFIAEHRKISASKIEVAIEHSAEEGNSILALDNLQLLMMWGQNYTLSRADIKEIHLPTMIFEEDLPDISRICFWSCMFDHLYISSVANRSNFPALKGCLIGSLDGVATLDDLPASFDAPEIIEFSDTISRNARILETDLPIATKVLLTVLNKLFNQAGSGRRENAFSRGLDPRGRSLVPDILRLIEVQKFAVPTKIRGQVIWLPCRDKTQRVKDIISRPITSADTLLERARNL